MLKYVSSLIVSLSFIFLEPASADEFQVGRESIQLGSRTLKVVPLGGGGLHSSTHFCALIGMTMTNASEQGKAMGGHIANFSFSIQPNEEGYWVVRHIGGRSKDNLQVGCFRLKS